MNDATKRHHGFDFELLLPACSANDCTGLIAASPATEEEWAAYQDIYDFCLPRIDQNRLAQNE